jgi:5-dehydro-2-deoxygluconokinase
VGSAAQPEFDLITMGRSSLDLYSNDVGVPFTEIRSFAAYVGGSPTNIAVGAGRLGLRTALLTAVGEDLVGDFILHFLEAEGIATQFIPRKSGTRTSAVVLGIEPPDRFPLVFYRDNAADVQLTIDDVSAMPIENVRAFEFAGTNLAKEPSRSATLFAAERAHAAGPRVFMDLDFRADQWDDPRAFGLAVRSILRHVHVAIGTEEEIKAAALQRPDQLTITRSQFTAPEVVGPLEPAIRMLFEQGLPVLVIKRGSQGSAVHLADGQVVNVPAFPVEVYNVLGAGDAFASGLIYGTLKGWDWYRSARMGNACGAIIVTRHGCANFMAYEQEALDFIEGRGGF